MTISYGTAAITNGKIYSNGTLNHQGTASGNLYSEVASPATPTSPPVPTEYSPTTSPTTIRDVLPGQDRLHDLPHLDLGHPGRLPRGRRQSRRTGRRLPECLRDRLQRRRHILCRSLHAGRKLRRLRRSRRPAGWPRRSQVPSNGAIYADETIIVGGTGSAASTVNGRVTVTSNNNIVIGNNISYRRARTPYSASSRTTA